MDPFPREPGAEGTDGPQDGAGSFTPEFSRSYRAGYGMDDLGGTGEGIEQDYDPDVMAVLDAWEPPDYLRNRPLPSRLVTWRRSSLLGAVMTGWAFGLREVLQPKQDEQIVIEVDADGEPHDLPIRLLLDPDDPSGSLCIVRRDPPEAVV